MAVRMVSLLKAKPLELLIVVNFFLVIGYAVIASATTWAQDGFLPCNKAIMRQPIVWEKLQVSPRHPRLILRPESLKEVRLRLNAEHPAWNRLVEKANHGGAAEAALLYQLTGEHKYADLAAEYLRKRAPNWTEYSMAFDWAFLGWDELTRKEMISTFANRFGFFSKDFPPVNKYTDLNQPLPSATPEFKWPNYYNWTFHSEDWADGSHESERYSPYFALAGHLGKANQGVQRIWEMSFKDAALFLNYLADGAFWEGGYWQPRGKLEKIVMAFTMLSTATQLNFSGNQFPYLPNMGYFLLYQTDLNSGQLIAHYGDSDLLTTRDWQARLGMLAANAMAKNSYFQWYLDHMTHPANVLKEALYYDPRIPSKHPRDLPPTRLFKGTKIVLFRSGWQGKNDLLGLFLLSDWFDSHNHFDAGHFMLYKNGVLVGKAGYYGHAFKDAIHHNTLALEMPGIVTGGQRIFPRTWSFRIGKRAWLKTPARFNRGCLTAFESLPDYDYMAADIAPAYPKNNIWLFNRHLVFIRPELLLILDKVRTDINVHKKFLLHVVSKPILGQHKLDNNWQEVEDQIITSQGSGTSILRVKSLLPAKARIRAVEERAAYIEPQRFAAAPWRIEIAPATQSEDDRFLNLFYAGDDDAAQMPETQYTQTILGDKMMGVHIKGADYNWQVLFSDINRPINQTIFSIEDITEVKHLIFNLPSKAPFRIRRNGSIQKTGQTSKAGTIFFEDNPAGKAVYELTITQPFRHLIIE
ncbi:MAG: hypothetical protein ACE5G1_03665 [bacterium]